MDINLFLSVLPCVVLGECLGALGAIRVAERKPIEHNEEDGGIYMVSSTLVLPVVAGLSVLSVAFKSLPELGSIVAALAATAVAFVYVVWRFRHRHMEKVKRIRSACEMRGDLKRHDRVTIIMNHAREVHKVMRRLTPKQRELTGVAEQYKLLNQLFILYRGYLDQGPYLMRRTRFANDEHARQLVKYMYAGIFRIAKQLKLAGLKVLEADEAA